MIPSFSEIEEFEWDVFTPPAHPVTGKNTIDAYQNGISITSSAPHPDESWEYIKWLTMGDGAVMYAQTIFPFPAHIPTAEGLIYVQDRTDPPTQLWILNQLLKDATPVFNGPAEGEIASIAGRNRKRPCCRSRRCKRRPTTLSRVSTPSSNAPAKSCLDSKQRGVSGVKKGERKERG